MSELVTFDVSDGVGVIRLNRPETLNALSIEMHDVLNEVFVQAYRSRQAKAVVFTGEGRGFCAGADMGFLSSLVESRGEAYPIPRPGGEPVAAFAGIDEPNELLTTYTFPLAMNKPIIAAVNGPAVGVGFILSACCDVRFVSDKAFFDTAFPQLGLVAEYGLAWLLPRLVGHGIASDILLSGRRVRAEEALEIGLANRVLPAEELFNTAVEYAQGIAASASAKATRLIRRQLRMAHHQSYSDATAQAWDMLTTCLREDDFQEGVSSFLERRAPKFTDS